MDTNQKTNSENALYHLIYLSQPTEYLDKSELIDMLMRAQTNNIQNEISGILIIKDKSIFQLIEGKKDTVLALYEKIKNDRRHKTPLIIFEGTSSYRLIPYLGMALTLSQSDDHLEINHDFYFSRSEAIKFTNLISGKAKELLLSYLE